jgi:hypothetical protein
MIEILPAHRGCGLGLAVASRLIDLYGAGCAVVACKPFASQFASGEPKDRDFYEGMRFDDLSRARARSFAKLRRYWARLGFRRAGRTDYFSLPMSLRRPKLDDICDLDRL